MVPEGTGEGEGVLEGERGEGGEGGRGVGGGGLGWWGLWLCWVCWGGGRGGRGSWERGGRQREKGKDRVKKRSEVYREEYRILNGLKRSQLPCYEVKSFR